MSETLGFDLRNLRRGRYAYIAGLVGVVLLLVGSAHQTQWHAGLASRVSQSFTVPAAEAMLVLHPDEELPSLRERLALALDRIPQYASQKNVWQSAKEIPAAPAAGEEPSKYWVGYKSWTELNPGHTQRFVDDDHMIHHIKLLASAGVPEVLTTYQNFPKIVLKSDFLRYVLVFLYGGVWADIDTQDHMPVDHWSAACLAHDPSRHGPHVGLIVGTEFDWDPDSGRQWMWHNLAISQYLFAGSRGHPVLLNMIAEIIEVSPSLPAHENPIVWTGPLRWTDLIRKYLEETQQVTRSDLRELRQPGMWGDVCVLPTKGFGSGRNEPEYEEAEKFAEHFFQFSWGG